MGYKPVEIRFGDDIKFPDSYIRCKQPIPFMVPKGTFLRALTLVIHETETFNELLVEVEYMADHTASQEIKRNG